MTGHSRTLSVSDATIAFTMQGSGPLLFLVGAPAGRAGFADLAAQLSDRFTVVTHDPRGIGDSMLEAGGAEPSPVVLAGDLIALTKHVAVTPSSYFGASGGAVTLLEVARRRPDVVRAAVAHEPPLVKLLDDPGLEERASAIFRCAPTDPQDAVQRFMDLTGAAHRTGPGMVPPAHLPLPALPRNELDKNRYFLGRMAGPTMFYEPDVDALRKPNIVVCAGEWSHGQLARRAAQALADDLGTQLLDMPGNHLGPSSEAATFAVALEALLA